MLFPAMDLCHQIGRIYPEVGECGIDMTVNYNKKKKSWVVDLRHGDHHLQTHLEDDDARTCMEGGQCLTLSTQIGQLVSNLEKLNTGD